MDYYSMKFRELSIETWDVYNVLYVSCNFNIHHPATQIQVKFDYIKFQSRLFYFQSFLKNYKTTLKDQIYDCKDVIITKKKYFSLDSAVQIINIWVCEVLQW